MQTQTQTLTQTLSLKPLLLSAIVATVASLAAPLAMADTYPSRPVTLVVPFPAGGVTDMIARQLAQQMQTGLGKPVVVENRPGGGGQIAAQAVKRAEADGYTVFIGATEMFAINPGLYRNFSYDPLKDFKPVTALAGSPLVLVVPVGSPVNSVSDLVQLSRSKGSGVNYASQGIGSIGHLLGGLFADKSGGHLTHVAYKGSAPALQDVMAGQVDMMFDPVITTSPLIKGGKVKPLAIASQRRSAQLPEVKTLSELGVKGLDAGVWFGMVVKAGTPDAIISRLNEEALKALKSPEIVRRFTDQGLEPMPMTPPQFGAFLNSENARWAPLVKASGASVE
ncbi:Bug family tripartite tricarboxylate transporter substrate binding protein [Cupriavidus sp. 2TAF22]|uniref:Bug family tripartite tricarboxylate transporter substrate binding protein n=1 Tax=unclassified Cupriavidus TaxID=2640874 RepID=UPI003F93BD1E